MAYILRSELLFYSEFLPLALAGAFVASSCLKASLRSICSLPTLYVVYEMADDYCRLAALLWSAMTTKELQKNLQKQ